jgi:hypothetical protein
MEDATNILVLGHSFIRHLAEKLEKKELQFVMPACITGRLQVLYHGKGGATLRSLLDFMKRTQFLGHYPPSVILLQIGGNDRSLAEFEVSLFQNDLEKITEHCQGFGCQVVVLSIWKRLNPWYCTVTEYNARRIQAHSLMESISGRGNGLWFFSSSLVSRKVENLDAGGVHPSPDGYVKLCSQQPYVYTVVHVAITHSINYKEQQPMYEILERV